MAHPPNWKERIREKLAPLQLAAGREIEIADELGQHLEDRYQERLARGDLPEQALRATLAELEQSRRMVDDLGRLEGPVSEPPAFGNKRRFNVAAELYQDLRYAARTLRKNPGFSAIVVLTLALGIGANTAIFSIVNSVILRPLPVKEPDRLVRLYESNLELGWPDFGVSHPNFLDWRSRNQTFESMGASWSTSLIIGNPGEIEVVPAGAITADLLPTLGVNPELGRNFLPQEDQPGAPPGVALLTHGYWARRFGGDRSIIGRTVRMNDNPVTIVGVLPESFPLGKGRLEIFVLLGPDPSRARGDHRLRVIGRLKPGVTAEQALADMNLIAQQLSQQFPGSNKGWKVGTQSLFDVYVPPDTRRSLLIFVAAVGFVLLIACSNIANLMLARAAGRQKEIAIRVSLGASRSRIIVQLLVEAVLLALVAGTLGVIVAAVSIDLLKTMNPANLPRLDELSLDGRVLFYALGISLTTGALFGFVPAIHASRPEVSSMLKDAGRSDGGGGRGRERIRSLLVVTEVMLSVALLISAGLLLRSFWKVQQVRPGFEPDHVLMTRITLPRNRYPKNAAAWAFYSRLLSEIKSLPGIESAATTSLPPMDQGNTSTGLRIPGRAEVSGTQPSADWRIVSPGYFRTLGIPLRGRDFEEHDTEDAPPVTIISADMARQYWPGEEAIGKTVQVFSFGQKTATVIGVAGDVKSFGLDADSEPMVYMPSATAAMWNPMSLLLRSATEPIAQATAVREALNKIDANVPIYDVQTADDFVARMLGPRKFTMFLIATFASLALLLACLGLFGVMSYLVSQRTHEIGIRMALGAQPRDVFRLVVGRGILLALIGSAIGLIGAYWMSRFMEGMLFGVKPGDPLTVLTAPLLLLIVALLACYIPARRAMKVDPLTALRHE